jgi:hypothetical protein
MGGLKLDSTLIIISNFFRSNVGETKNPAAAGFDDL